MITIEPPSKQAAAGGPSYSALRKSELRQFLRSAAEAIGVRGEVHVLLSDDAALRRLNKAFRKKDKATDVLSFPAAEGFADIAGDLAISLETAARQAGEHGHPLKQEVRILLLHGLLHLAGYDHETDAGEMAAEEMRLRDQLGLPTGLIERTGAKPISARQPALRTSAAESAATPRAVTRSRPQTDKSTPVSSARSAAKPRASKPASPAARKLAHPAARKSENPPARVPRSKH